MAATKPLEPDLEFVRKLRAAGGDDVNKCYQCATCSVACPLSPEDNPFPRKEMIWAQWGLKDRLMADPDIWLCYQCNDCSKLCPRGAHPGDVLAAVRKMAFEHYATPSALGKALNSPSALPLLLAIPIALFIAVIVYGGQYNAMFPEVLQHGSWYGRFFPLLAIDTIFIVTLTAMVLIMAMSITRFWKDMKVARPGAPKLDIIPAIIEMVKEVLFHKRFTECGAAQPRKAPHLLTFWGMVMLFATTAIVFVGLYFLGLHVPMGITNPVKWLGIAGASAFIVGVFQLWSMRRNDPDAAGKSAYQDWLFLWMLFLVGITGIFSYLLRLWSQAPEAEGMPEPGVAIFAAVEGDSIAFAAIGVYFVHLVTVWFLLGFLPYSKFAHMAYRATALVYSFRIGRIEPAETEGEPHGHDDEEEDDEEDEGEAHPYEEDEEDEEEEKKEDDH